MTKTRHILTFWAAVVAFGLALYMHVAALCGWIEEISFGRALLMHVLIFVFILTGIQRHHRHQKAMTKQGEFKGVKNVFEHAPSWSMSVFKVLFLYVFIYFILVVIFEVGVPEGGAMSMALGFSAHWLLFYFVAIMLWFPLPERDRNEDMGRYRKD